MSKKLTEKKFFNKEAQLTTNINQKPDSLEYKLKVESNTIARTCKTK